MRHMLGRLSGVGLVAKRFNYGSILSFGHHYLRVLHRLYDGQRSARDGHTPLVAVHGTVGSHHIALDSIRHDSHAPLNGPASDTRGTRPVRGAAATAEGRSCGDNAKRTRLTKTKGPSRG